MAGAGVGGEQQFGWDALGCKLDDSSLELFLACAPEDWGSGMGMGTGVGAAGMGGYAQGQSLAQSLALVQVQPAGWGDFAVYGRGYRRGLALQWLCCRAARGQGQGLGQGQGQGQGQGRKPRRPLPGAGAGAGPEDPAAGLRQSLLSAPPPGFQSLLALLRRRDWDLLLRVWAIASEPVPPSRLQRRLAMTALAGLAAMAEVQEGLAGARVLPK